MMSVQKRKSIIKCESKEAVSQGVTIHINVTKGSEQKDTVDVSLQQMADVTENGLPK